MTKRQAERYMRLQSDLMAVGCTRDEVDALLLCSKRLSTWDEHECNGVIQREEDGTPYWWNPNSGRRIGKARDLETGAERRAKAICDAHGLTMYRQGDPRGCALWVLRPGDVPEGESVGAYYTRGVAVCID